MKNSRYDGRSKKNELTNHFLRNATVLYVLFTTKVHEINILTKHLQRRSLEMFRLVWILLDLRYVPQFYVFRLGILGQMLRECQTHDITEGDIYIMTLLA